MPFTLNPNAPAFVMSANAPAFVPSQICSPPNAGATDSASSKAIDAEGVIATEAALLQAVGRLSKEVILFLDCEGADLSKGSWLNGALQVEAGINGIHGRLCLIQIGTASGEVYAIDIFELGLRAFDLGLRQLLENPAIMKVAHDFRQDSDALWHQFMVSPKNLFDTQLCDVLIRRLKGMRTTYVCGSAKLATNHGIEAQTIPGYGLLTQERKLEIHERFAQDRHLWERRPLPEDMVIYAKADVLPLPSLHRALFRDLVALVGDEAAASRLVLAASEAYTSSFVILSTCRCRLCCRAEESAKFDGCRVFTRLANNCDQGVLQRLLRPEDAHPLPEPGPTRFYINEDDESVPIPGQ